MSRLFSSFLVLVFCPLALGDLIHLKDGTTLEGTVKKTPGGWTVTGADGKNTTIASDAVKSISLVGRETSPAASDDKLASLRRAVQNVSDAKQIVSRYRNFIAANMNTPAAAEAQKDLSIWQDRVDKGLVKVGSQWMTPQDRDRLKEKLVGEADHVRQLIKDNRLSEAEAAVNQALDVDPANGSFLYLEGLLHYRENQIVPARKAFETSNQKLPNHAPTLNNLAVIAVRQNQWLLALGYFDQAMVASPENKQVLDNVAEVLNALPAANLRAPIAQKVDARFAQQDQALAAKLQKEGQYRWGATWVTAQQFEQLKQAESQAKAKLDSLAADYDATNNRIATIDSTIADNEKTMRNYEAIQYYDPAGARYRGGAYQNGYQYGLPSSYYDLQADNDKLSRERQQQIAKLEELRQEARAIQKQYPIPKYTGTVKMIDVEGTPVELPGVNAPATQPTATPSPARRSAPVMTPLPATQPTTKHTGWKV